MPSVPDRDERWTAIDAYFMGVLGGDDEALRAALDTGAAAGLPAIDVTASQGKLLHLLARLAGARSILELGTLAGYSTIWLARALPDGGRLVTLELDPRYAAVARENVERAGQAERVELRVGPAAETLRALVAAGEGPFDLVFIDADKRGAPEYVERALELTRPGSVIVLDNVVRGGETADPMTNEEGALGMRRAHELIAAEPRLTATALQTVGAKGHDGFTLALVTA